MTTTTTDSPLATETRVLQAILADVAKMRWIIKRLPPGPDRKLGPDPGVLLDHAPRFPSTSIEYLRLKVQLSLQQVGYGDRGSEAIRAHLARIAQLRKNWRWYERKLALEREAVEAAPTTSNVDAR